MHMSQIFFCVYHIVNYFSKNEMTKIACQNHVILTSQPGLATHAV